MLVAVREDRQCSSSAGANGVWADCGACRVHTLSAARIFADQSLQRTHEEPQALSLVQHSFTHFDLVIAPLLTRCSGPAPSWMRVRASGITLRACAHRHAARSNPARSTDRSHAVRCTRDGPTGELSVSRLVQWFVEARSARARSRALSGELGQRIYEQVPRRLEPLDYSSDDAYERIPADSCRTKSAQFLSQRWKILLRLGSKAPEGFKPPVS